MPATASKGVNNEDDVARIRTSCSVYIVRIKKDVVPWKRVWKISRNGCQVRVASWANDPC